jgi:2-polyprenyl-3-methyl-5-hydroxy-6-metoxy-1,4-benzoquinol methylase
MNENVVEDFGWSSGVPPDSYDCIAPRILAILKQLDVKRVLDLGAGTGALCAQLESAGYQVVGAEYDKKGVHIARSSYPEITFYNFGVQDNPADLLAREQEFDVVVSTEVIEHLFSPHLLPICARGVLRPGGYLVVTTPYHGYLKNLALSIFDHWDFHHNPLRHGGHIKFWSRATLSQLLSENGFRVIGFSGVGRVPYLWKSMVLVGQKA